MKLKPQTQLRRQFYDQFCDDFRWQLWDQFGNQLEGPLRYQLYDRLRKLKNDEI